MPDQPRVFGQHESEAMFEAIGNALAILERGGSVWVRFLCASGPGAETTR